MHLHFLRSVRTTRHHDYRVCRCGKRKVVRLRGNPRAHPFDRGWLETGEWTPSPTEPPPKPADARRSASPPSVAIHVHINGQPFAESVAKAASRASRLA